MIEYNEEYNRKILEIVKRFPVRYGTSLRSKKNRYLFDYIMACTESLDPKTWLSIRIVWVLNKWQKYPTCIGCGKPLDTVGGSFRLHLDENDRPKWKKYHSSHCWHEDPEAIVRMNNTLEERYGKGVTNVFQVESIKEKCGDTREEKYGNRNYRNMEKVAETCLEKYGSKSVLSSKYGKKRIKETNLRKYGVEYAVQSSEIRSKMHRTYDYDGQNFDTGWELAFYVWHKDHGIDLIHEPDKLQYEDQNGNKHFYFPDFKIGDIYYEIKGGQFFDKDGNPVDDYKDKFEFMKSIGVVLIREKEIKPYLEYVAEKYGKNFLKSCKRNGKQKF